MGTQGDKKSIALWNTLNQIRLAINFIPDRFAEMMKISAKEYQRLNANRESPVRKLKNFNTISQGAARCL